MSKMSWFGLSQGKGKGPRWNYRPLPLSKGKGWGWGCKETALDLGLSFRYNPADPPRSFVPGCEAASVPPCGFNQAGSSKLGAGFSLEILLAVCYNIVSPPRSFVTGCEAASKPPPLF